MDVDKPFLPTFTDVFGAVREPLVVLDATLRVVKANSAFYRLFEVEPQETEGLVIYNLGSRQWDIPKLRELLETILPKNQEFKDFEVEHTFEDIGLKIMHLNARRICNENDDNQLILMAIEDVTERECSKRHLDDIVRKRTSELTIAQQNAEESKRIAETALEEVKKLKDQLEAEREYLLEEIKLELNYDTIIGQSNEIKYVLYKVEQVATTDTTVLIQGETGTGKELIARAIHDSSSCRDRAMVKMNCAALPANLIESELFGHERGAFTGANNRRIGRFELANGTTLFLDEIGELPLELQPKLLQVLESGRFERLGSSQTQNVNVRIIAATNRNLEKEVREGRFREDLWYRLNIFPITMPPLRDRLDDIPLLVQHFVGKISKRLGKVIEVIPAGVMTSLQSHSWPGNIRELENVLERAVINSSGPKLSMYDELKHVSSHEPDNLQTLAAVEREYIIRVLEQTQWKVSGKNSASEILGIERSTLRGRMRKLNISKE